MDDCFGYTIYASCNQVKVEYKILRQLCHVAKNLKNHAIYNVRQHYFECQEYFSYNKMLNSNMAVDKNFKSFFGLLRLAKKGEYAFEDCKL